MDFHFDSTFALLWKLTIGLRPTPTSEEELKRMSIYLGTELSTADVEESAESLRKALQSQNGFLARNLESDSIYDSDEYHKSKFIRDIVANNRDSRARRVASSC